MIDPVKRLLDCLDSALKRLLSASASLLSIVVTSSHNSIPCLNINVTITHLFQNYYNVTFLDAAEVTRAWIAPNKLRPYFAHGKVVPYQQQKVPINFQRRINTAIKQANEASKLPVLERLQKYSFIARYKGTINSPKINHGSEKYLSKYHDLSSRTSDSSSSDSEDSSPSKKMHKILMKRKPIADNTRTIVEKRDNPTKTNQLTVDNVNKEKVSSPVVSDITIIKESEAVAWKDKAIIRQRSASSVSIVSEEIPIQTPLVYRKSLKKLLSKDDENSKSLNSEGIPTHSQSCVDVIDVATGNISGKILNFSYNFELDYLQGNSGKLILSTKVVCGSGHVVYYRYLLKYSRFCDGQSRFYLLVNNNNQIYMYINLA